MSSGKPNVQALKLVLTCEHAYPDIPARYANLFNGAQGVLDTHEAFDPGALDVFSALKSLADSSHYQAIGRLLIESNRSQRHKSLFSRFTQSLSEFEKNEILNTYYIPYREKVEKSISSFIQKGEKVLHLSVHSFTPVLNENVRNADLGLLYDPQRKEEKLLAGRWKELIIRENSKLKVRYNYPYLGKSDGFTTSLRKIFPENYLGIELEINQKWVTDNKMDISIKDPIVNSVRTLKN